MNKLSQKGFIDHMMIIAVVIVLAVGGAVLWRITSASESNDTAAEQVVLDISDYGVKIIDSESRGLKYVRQESDGKTKHYITSDDNPSPEECGYPVRLWLVVDELDYMSYSDAEQYGASVGQETWIYVDEGSSDCSEAGEENKEFTSYANELREYVANNVGNQEDDLDEEAAADNSANEGEMLAEGWVERSAEKFGLVFETPEKWEIDTGEDLGRCAEGRYIRIEVDTESVQAAGKEISNNELKYVTIKFDKDKDSEHKDCGGVTLFGDFHARRVLPLGEGALSGDYLMAEIGTESESMFVAGEEKDVYDHDMAQTVDLDGGAVTVGIIFQKSKPASGQYFDTVGVDVAKFEQTKLFSELVMFLESIELQ